MADTAAKTGRSERSIALDAERGGKIADDVIEEVAGTALDTGQTLDELKNLSHEEQRERVKEKKTAPKKTTRGGGKSKGKSLLKSEPLVHKTAPAPELAAHLETCFAALWQWSVDVNRSEIREWTDKIERALEKKGIVPASERQRDAKGYLARLKPKTAATALAAKA